MKNLLYFASKSWTMLDLKSKLTFYLSVFLFILTACLRVSGPVFFAYLLQHLSGDEDFLFMLAFVYASIFCVSRFLEEFRLACYIYFEQILQKSLVLNTLEKYFKLSFDFVRNHNSSETSIIIDRGLGGVRTALYNAVFTLLPLLAECSLLLIVIGIKTKVILSLILLGLIAIFIAVTFYFSSKTQKLQQKWFSTASKNYQIMAEGIRSFEFLRSFQQTLWMRNRYEKATEKFVNEVRQSLKPGITLGMIQGMLLFLLFIIPTLGVLHITEVTSERVSLLVIVNGLLLQISVPLLQFSASYRFFVQGLSSARQLLDLTEYPISTEKVPHATLSSVNGIALKNIAITLPGGQCIKFKDDFISPTGITVLIGPSGIGKSTLVKIIAGIVNYEGEIKSSFSINDVYYLHQHVDIFDLSLKDNIILGQPYDREKFIHIVQECGFTDKEISDLSERTLGEGGKSISGGQAQRIGLARMLYHDAKVMLLDEPTSGLDDETVQKVIGTIKRVAKGRTCIIVTHDSRLKDVGDTIMDVEKMLATDNENSAHNK